MPGIDECLLQAMAIPGVMGSSLVDYTSGLALGMAGKGPDDDHHSAAAGMTEVARAAIDNAAFVSKGPGDSLEDIIITADGRYHLLKFVKTTFDSRLFLYVWMDRHSANLAMARRKLHEIADALVLA